MRFKDSLRRIMRERGIDSRGIEQATMVDGRPGVSAQMARLYMRGRYIPKADSLRMLADVLGCTMDELWGEGL